MGCALPFGTDAFGSVPSEGLIAAGDPVSLDVPAGDWATVSPAADGDALPALGLVLEP